MQVEVVYCRGGSRRVGGGQDSSVHQDNRSKPGLAQTKQVHIRSLKKQPLWALRFITTAVGQPAFVG